MNFDCDRCGYSTSKRSDFIRHLSRKEPCIATVSNIPIIDIKKKYQIIEPTPLQDASSHPFECLYCNRRYKYKYNKTKHLKTCSVRLESEMISTQINDDSPTMSATMNASVLSMMNEIMNSLSVLNKKIDQITENQQINTSNPYVINLFHNTPNRPKNNVLTTI